MRYLIDTSVFVRLAQPVVAAAVGPLITAGQVAISAPVAFELGYSARSPADYAQVMHRLDAMPWLPTTDGNHRRALEIQSEFAAGNSHRSLSLVDALVAATAEDRDVAVLHYDADFERIGEITHQPQVWACRGVRPTEDRR